MEILSLLKDDVESGILSLVLDYIKINVAKDDSNVTFPEICYGEKICFEHENTKSIGFIPALYSLTNFYGCFSELFNEDEGKLSENESHIFHLSNCRYKLTYSSLKNMDSILFDKSFIVSNKHCSITDIFYFCATHKYINTIPVKDRVEYLNLFRWFIYIQDALVGDFCTLKKLQVRDSLEILINSKDSKSLNEKVNKTNERENKNENSKNIRNNDKRKNDKKSNDKNINVKNVEDTRSLDDISRLNIIVGYIEQIENHPDADALYCLKVNVGEENSRDICAGLRNKKKAEDLLHKYVLILGNLREKVLRGKKSHGMILCGSFEDKIETLNPPFGVKVGERIVCENMDTNRLPDKVLSFSKEKNPFFHIQPNLILKNGIVYYKGNMLISSQGPITCVLQEGTIS